jgi:UDP-N-acetylglucosamine diphosphorylase/glucosamine-1-phosphate N-acetyltransferase
MLREIGELRLGILTLREKWELLARKSGNRHWMNHPGIPPHMVPAAAWLRHGEEWISQPESIPASEYRLLERPWQMPLVNSWAIREDFGLLTSGRVSAPIPEEARVSGDRGQLFLEEGARLEHCFINVTEGPVYVGQGAVIQEGAMLRGPIAICEGAVVKMGAILYGGTTIGIRAVAGGEIKNSILSDFANKGHHGYLGDAVIGNWCNIGAGSSCSNVKNNAGTVRVMDMSGGQYLPAGNKCGLLMGDFSRSAINTSFNTGTVTGICASIFDGSGLTPKFIPSFSWGGFSSARSELGKEIHSISAWMKMKGHEPSPELLERIRQAYSTTNP